MNMRLSELFVDLAKYAAITIVVISGVMASAAIASSQGYRSGGEIPFKPVSAQLEIKSPNNNLCPANATMTGWVMTSRPGEITYMIATKGGEVSGPFTARAVKSATGGIATFTRNIHIQKPLSAEYRVLVVGNSQSIKSAWSPLNARCTIKLGPKAERQKTAS